MRSTLLRENAGCAYTKKNPCIGYYMKVYKTSATA